MRFALSIAAAGSTLLSCSSGQSAPASTFVSSPVVIELYQSQGCSSCPPANAALNAIAANPSVLALSFAVTYWDRLGWKDRFAKPEFTQRQYDYAHARGSNGVFTPQFVINGQNAGSNSGSLQQIARKAGSARGGPSIEVAGNAIVVGAAKAAKPATVWLVTYDPRVRNVAIRAGENGGRTLPHRNVVTSLKALGKWAGSELRFSIPPSADPALRRAAFIQNGKGGPIISAHKL